MRYTIWSRGELVGHTDLDFIYRENGFRAGYFHPTHFGETAIAVFERQPEIMRNTITAADRARMCADLASANDRIATLELELRDHGGEVIPTLDISIRDTEQLLALGADDDEEEHEQWLASLTPEKRAEFEASVAHDMAVLDQWAAEAPIDFEGAGDEPWQESKFPRYQIMLRLTCD